MKVLIIQQKMIGDVLITSTLCNTLKKLYPSSQIHYLINSNTVAVVKNNPSIDELIEFLPEYKSSKKMLWRFAKSIQAKKYDLLIDVYSKPESNLVSLLSKATIRVSYHKLYSRWIYTHTVKRSKGNSQQRALNHRLDLLNTALLSSRELPINGAETTSEDPNINRPPFLPIKTLSPPEIFINPQELAIAADFLHQQGIDSQTGKPIMLNVLGTHKNKTYPLDYMAEIVDFIAHNTSADLLINYMPSQQAEVAELIALCQPSTQLRLKFKNVTPSLRSFLAILSQCSVLIGNESGAVHMAQALNIPTFAIFSPWVPTEEWALKKDQAHLAVHIQQIQPECIENQSTGDLKKMATQLYRKLKPANFTDQLQQFLQQFVEPK